MNKFISEEFTELEFVMLYECVVAMKSSELLKPFDYSYSTASYQATEADVTAFFRKMDGIMDKILMEAEKCPLPKVR